MKGFFPFPKVFSFLVCLTVNCCSCFSLVYLYPPVGALPPQYLSEINFFVTTHVSEVKPREMLGNYITRKLCHFEVIWLKGFFCFVCYYFRNCYIMLWIHFFWVFYWKLNHLGTKEWKDWLYKSMLHCMYYAIYYSSKYSKFLQMQNHWAISRLV